ncbi:hypothetical protein [Flavobacterium microcysteis]|uniref:Uncharacterized protein n=1 Tax=Flavobacterium microcysteis TaxID=2596891 RepID=A0A501Q4M1_9FLAO|nr:hypothetical protein [Flavobacterium microcysteis]TPD66871.1 hypothetical protein FJA49_11325 [Flavobacterium microcysteis]
MSISLTTTLSYSQTKKKKHTDGSEKLDCVRKTKINLQQRLANYPYNQTSQIKLIAYQNKGEAGVGEEIQKYLNASVGKKAAAIESQFDEIKSLNFDQIEKLTDIIYNYGYKANPDFLSAVKCYMPRNAILFYDNTNHLIAFIELCFECRNYRTNDSKITLGDDCTQKLSMIKDLFNQNGIKYGVTETEFQ